MPCPGYYDACRPPPRLDVRAPAALGYHPDDARRRLPPPPGHDRLVGALSPVVFKTLTDRFVTAVHAFTVRWSLPRAI